MFKTIVLSQQNPAITTASAEVLDTLHENGHNVIILDQTPFQEHDTGVIETESKLFRVSLVRIDEDEVYHVGEYESSSEPFFVNEKVSCTVDVNHRKNNT